METKESIDNGLGKSTGDNEEDTVTDKETTENADDDGETTEKSAADVETTENAGRMQSTVKMGRLVDIVDHVQHALTSKTY